MRREVVDANALNWSPRRGDPVRQCVSDEPHPRDSSLMHASDDHSSCDKLRRVNCVQDTKPTPATKVRSVRCYRETQRAVISTNIPCTRSTRTTTVLPPCELSGGARSFVTVVWSAGGFRRQWRTTTPTPPSSKPSRRPRRHVRLSRTHPRPRSSHLMIIIRSLVNAPCR